MRPLISLVIGAVLALLMAMAAQLLVVPFLGPGQEGVLPVVSFIVFWAMMALVVVTIVRGRRAAQ